MSELPVSDTYLAGLIEGGGNLNFQVRSAQSHVGYMIRPHIRIGVDDPYTYGMLDEVVELFGLQVQWTEREHTVDCRIESRSSLQILFDRIRPHLHLLNRSVAFLEERLWPAYDKHDTRDRAGFFEMIREIDRLKPNRASKYTADYFESEWDDQVLPTDEPGLAYPVPQPPQLNDEYLAGLFDGGGSLVPSISSVDDTTVGYILLPRLSIQRSILSEAFFEQFEEYADQYGIAATYDEKGSSHRLTLYERDSIQALLTRLAPNLIGTRPTIEAFLSEVLPRLESGVHQEKQAFYDAVVLFSELTPDVHPGRKRKYTPAYFEKEWDGQVTPRTADEILAETGTEASAD